MMIVGLLKYWGSLPSKSASIMWFGLEEERSDSYKLLFC